MSEIKFNIAEWKERLKNGADIEANCKNEMTPLMSAVLGFHKDNYAVVKKMVELGADVNATDQDNETPLFWTHWCDADVIKTFIDAGADVNAQDNNGKTPLSYAKYNSKDKTIEELLAHGARLI